MGNTQSLSFFRLWVGRRRGSWADTRLVYVLGGVRAFITEVVCE